MKAEDFAVLLLIAALVEISIAGVSFLLLRFLILSTNALLILWRRYGKNNRRNA